MTEAEWLACAEPRTMLWFLDRRRRGVLAHWRGPGPHVRGCRVVDLILEVVNREPPGHPRADEQGPGVAG
jgi:hypothetical protein